MDIKNWNQLDEISRRKFINYVAKALLGVGINGITNLSNLMGHWSPYKVPSANNLIYLYMAGGMSHIDTFELKSEEKVRGPVEAIPCKGEIGQISHYLPMTAKVVDRVAVIRLLHLTQ